jgi:hypothetical protein
MKQDEKDLVAELSLKDKTEHFTMDYLQIVEKELEMTQKVIEKEMIFNPNVAQIEINPIVKLKADAKQCEMNAKNKLCSIQKGFMRPKQGVDETTITEIFTVDRAIVQLSKSLTTDEAEDIAQRFMLPAIPKYDQWC